ncbi:MAG: ATP-binding protein [bacterium]|nr:ATP-binding protein [bacterium]
MPTYVRRYLEEHIKKDLQKKMVFIGGPRQSGKTTLAKHIIKQAGAPLTKHYMTWDALEDREHILKEEFPAGPGYLILDEIHKYSRWQQTVKGLYDKRGNELKILVTGSARLDLYRKGGDSMQGRYYFYRCFPFSVKEIRSSPAEALDHLFHYGGFPEPFLSADEKEVKRWSREYRTRLIRVDLRDMERINEIDLIERMVIRLPDLVGSPLSVNAVREDLQVSHQSVTRWLNILENLYMIFRVYPFGSPRIRAVKKEAKHYHVDWTIVSDKGKRFENLVACHLLKWCYFLQDSEGRNVELRYLRDTDKREVDFVVVEDGKPVYFIECKVSEKDISPALHYFKLKFPQTKAYQILLEGRSDWVNKEGIRVCPAYVFLNELV